VSDSRHRTYLLRVWREAEHDRPPAFRAVLTDVSTHETHYFADPAALARHLRVLDAGRDPDDG